MLTSFLMAEVVVVVSGKRLYTHTLINVIGHARDEAMTKRLKFISSRNRNIKNQRLYYVSTDGNRLEPAGSKFG